MVKSVLKNKLNIYLFFSVSTFIFIGYSFFSSGPVSASDQDELPYINSTKAFVDFNSFKTTTMLDEDVSKILQADWYGPGYPLIYGFLSKIIGSHNKTFIIINIGFLLVCIVLILLLPFEKINDRLWIIASLLLSIPVLNYLFYFMPVILDLLFTTILVFILFKISKRYDSKNSSEHIYIFAYLLLCLIFSLVKKNFFFFSFGILPFATSKKKIITYFLLITAIFFINSLYSKYFIAPPLNYTSMRALEYFMSGDIKKGFELFYPHLLQNIQNLFLLSFNTSMPLPYILSYILIISMPFLALFYGIKYNDKLLLSISIILLFSIGILFFFYITVYNYLLRISLGLILMSLLSLKIISKKTRYVGILTFISLLYIYFTPSTISRIKEEFRVKSENYKVINDEMKENFKLLSYIKTNEDEIITVLYDKAFLSQYQTEIFLPSLPFSTIDNKRLRYTTNYGGEAFFLHGKLKINYILAIQPKKFEYPVELIAQTEKCCIYKVL